LSGLSQNLTKFRQGGYFNKFLRATFLETTVVNMYLIMANHGFDYFFSVLNSGLRTLVMKIPISKIAEFIRNSGTNT
jgi:hypothetical protein